MILRKFSLLFAVLLLSTSALAQDSPREVAEENNAEAEYAMKLAEKGVDEDGEKVWKHEARDWLDFSKHKNHRTFELSSKWARKVTGEFYKLGAEKVWMVNISETEFDGQKYILTDDMVIELPADASKRKAIFDFYNRELELEADDEKLIDIGQKYIFITGD